MDKILVSVIIPNYNYSQYLEQCLKSVLESDFESDKLEIIVVDDASTDDSVKVIGETMNGCRFNFKFLRNETNYGLIISRNRGIVNAHGEFLFFLDSDNYINEDCLKIHAAVLQQNPEAIACYAPIQNFDNNTGVISGQRSNHPFDYQRLINGPYIDTMAMFRKAGLIEAGMYDTRMPGYGYEDYELWLRLGKMGYKVVFIPGRPLTFYRMHKHNKSQNYKPDHYNQLIYYLKQKYHIRLPALKTEALNDLLTQKNYYAQLFYTVENSLFSEENSLKTGITDSPFQFTLPGAMALSAVRFDPLNDYTIVTVGGFRFFKAGEEVFPVARISSNAGWVEGSKYYFDSSDPQFTIGFDEPTRIEEIVVDVTFLAKGPDVFKEMEAIHTQKTYEFLQLQKSLERCKAKLAQRDEELNKLFEDLNCKQHEIDRLKRQLSGKGREFFGINNSVVFNSSKLSSPFSPRYLFSRLKEKIRLKREAKLINESELFDEEFYLSDNPDVKSSGIAAIKHYLVFGGFEGRNPSSEFDSRNYLDDNPDVKSSGTNPLVHYIRFGQKEGRKPQQPLIFLNARQSADVEEYEEHTLSLPVNLVVKNPLHLKSFNLENDGNTEFINRYFDKIYVINLRRRQNKLIEIAQKLKRLNISAEIIEAVDGYKSPHIDEYRMYEKNPMVAENTHIRENELKRKLIYSPGVWGHLKSNRLILKDALAKGYQRILILEDDTVFIKNFHQEFKKFSTIIAKTDWKFLYLGASQRWWDIPEDIVYPDKSILAYLPEKPYYHPVSVRGSFAFGVHHSQFKNLIAKIDEMNCPFDWIYSLSFNHLADHSIVAQPNLIVADLAISDNRPKENSFEEKQQAITRRKWDMPKYDYPTKKDIVSIVMAAYNAQGTIKFAIKSLQKQTYRDIEIIVVDDGSSDDTSGIVEHLAQTDSRIKISKLAENVGLYASRNIGIRKSIGQFITFHDADDIALTNRIESQLAAIIAGRAEFSIPAFVRTNLIVDELSSMGDDEIINMLQKEMKPLSSDQTNFAMRPCLSMAMFSRDVFAKHGLFWETRFAGDTELIERIFYNELKVIFAGKKNELRDFIMQEHQSNRLFSFIDKSLIICPQKNQSNLTIKYPMEGAERELFCQIYKNRLAGIGDYKYPVL